MRRNKMEIANFNSQLHHTALRQNYTSLIPMNNYLKIDSKTNLDIFIKDNNAGKKTEILTSKTAAVQTNSTNTPNVCLDVIKRAAAKKAGISLSHSGVPNINNSLEAHLYFEEMFRINNCFYSQSGGRWNGLAENSIDGCERTAAATMVSINSGYTVTPNDTIGPIVVNWSENTRTNQGTYSTVTGAAQGLCEYSCGSESGVIAAINNELKAGRSVMVKTTVHEEHWVTVTGTIDGKYANPFEDFVGIDPWYNVDNDGNPSTGTGSGATNDNRAGVIQLSDVKGQKLSDEYRIITFKP